MKKILVLILALISVNIQCIASEVQKGGIERVDLTFEQAYVLMLENNNSLKAYNEMIKQNKYEKRSALGKFAPKIGLNATYMHLNEDSQLTTPVSASIMGININTSTTSLIQEQNLFTAGGAVVWNIFTGGKLLSNHAAARAKLEASNEKYREVKDDLTLELVKRYYGLRLARDVVEVRKQIAEGISKHYEDAILLEKEGIIPKSERLHAQVANSEAQREYKAAIRDANVIEEGLKTLIKAQETDLTEVYIQPNSLLFVFDETTINLQKLKEESITNNPQLKQLKAKKKALNAKFHAKMAEYSPTISLFAYDVAAASHLSETFPRAAIGGTANWLLFDGLSRLNDVKAANCERKAVDYQIIDAQYNIESLINKQYQELMKYREMYESSNTSIENAQEAVRTATLAFKEGFGTSLQVTDAQMMLSKVRIDRLNDIYKYDVSLTDLLKTSGNTNLILDYIKTSKYEKF